MLDYCSMLGVSKDSIVNRDIPLDKVFSSLEVEKYGIKSVRLLASINQTLTGIEPSTSEDLRYQEIHIVYVETSEWENIYECSKPVFKQIRYPVLLVYHYQNKFRLVSCNFKPGKLDYGENILKTIVFTSWIYPDEISDKAKQCFNGIIKAWNEENIADSYMRIMGAVSCFFPLCWTKNHTYNALGLIGLKDKDFDEVLKYATVYIKHGKPDYNKYSKVKYQNIVYRYDTEDIWYGMLKYEKTRRIIEGRRIRNMEEYIAFSDDYLFNNRKWH